MSESRKGALITPELTALVHWTTGRCASATPQEAVRLGGELLDRIQEELNEKFSAGVSAVRRTQVGSEAGENWSPAIPAFRPIGSDLDKEVYANGSGV